MADISKISINGTNYNVKDSTARGLIPNIEKLTLSGTTGTSLYSGYYYVNIQIPEAYWDREIISINVTYASQNNPTFVQMVSTAPHTFRVYSVASENTVSVEVIIL